jgi:Fe-S-cluster-containing dehydrogenase component/DMSO reductase anchor subunit
MTTVVPSRALVPAPARERRRLPLVDQLLREQQDLSAVERFAQRHADATEPLRARYYRDLLPAAPPAKGQQYAFEVDLDACTGCKACVTACHNLNGLDDGEAWRTVGLLHGGTSSQPVQQTVTTACHHCLDPACMNGCPVGAYEKDALTGIVKHLDDQCIGCQYCTFTCPYDVPKFNAERGIVRKCDMCSGRLAAGEAPACVQACPNEAIHITVVDRRQVLEDTQGDAFVPGAPSPGITAPTTVYKTRRALPRNLLPASFYTVSPSHAHRPLVFMLVMTQLSVGAFVMEALGSRWLPAEAAALLGSRHALLGVAIGLAALAASVLHLGRPAYAFRALLGLRTSWMSREILAFGIFAPLAILYASSFWVLPHLAPERRDALGAAVAGVGLLGVACSVLIYHVTRRAWWTAASAGFKFGMTTVLMGAATANLTLSLGARSLGGSAHAALLPLFSTVSRLVVAAAILKVVGELAVLRHLADKRYSDLKRTAVLVTRDLRGYTVLRLACAVVGLVATAIPMDGQPSAVAAGIAWSALLAGEFFERTLFFAAVSTPGMPRGHS